MRRALQAERLAPLVESLSSKYLGPDFGVPGAAGGAGAGVSLLEIDGLVNAHAPLCMRNLFARLRVRGSGIRDPGLVWGWMRTATAAAAVAAKPACIKLQKHMFVI